MNASPESHPDVAPLGSNSPSEAQDRSGTASSADRGIPSVNRVRSLQSRVTTILAIALMSVLGVGLLGWYYGNALTRNERAQRAAELATRNKASGDMPLPSPGNFNPPASDKKASEAIFGPPPELPAHLAANDVSASTQNDTVPAPASYAAQTGAQTQSPGQLAFERRMSGAAFARATQTSSIESSALIEPEMSSQPSSLSTQGEGSALASLLVPTATPAAQAQVLPTQRLLLPKGAFIDCTLETAIDSTLPGMTTCITATDTYSADGKVILLERGTKLVGETQGQVRQGAARLFVLWTEARTPSGVVVPLASPGTDQLGRAGHEGHVNRHFWQRFGAAILISVIDGAIQTAAAANQNGDTTVITNSNGTSEILTEVLRTTVNLPPTVIKHHGDRIQILVARDLDFRSVYELRAVAAAQP